MLVATYMMASQTDGQADRLQSIMPSPIWGAQWYSIDGNLAFLFSGYNKSLTDIGLCHSRL